MAGISHHQPSIRNDAKFRMEMHKRLVRKERIETDAKNPRFSLHGVSGIGGKIDNNLINLGGIGEHRRCRLRQIRFNDDLCG